MLLIKTLIIKTKLNKLYLLIEKLIFELTRYDSEGEMRYSIKQDIND
jgi:hypothetical protein